MASLRAALALLLLPGSAGGVPTPSFPKAMRYKCEMRVAKGCKDMFAGNNFTGVHYIDATLQRGRTDWLMTCPNGSCGRFGPSPTSVGVNVDGGKHVFFQTFANMTAPKAVGGALPASCLQLPWPTAAFDERWAENATYQGPHVLEGRLCHRWSNTVPYFVQRVQRVSDYYADFYSMLPVAYFSADGAIDLRFSDVAVGPQPASLFDVSGLGCKAPPHPAVELVV